MGTPTIDRTTNLKQYHDHSGSHIRKVGRYVGSTSYATGGDPLTPNTLGIGKIDVLLIEALYNGSVILIARYNVTNSTMQVFDLAGAEIAAATDLSAYSARFEAIGI